METFDKTEIRASTKIAFDVDLTLITHDDRPLYDNLVLLNWFVNKGYDVYVWSGGGVDYAEMWVRRLGFEGKVTVVAKGSIQPDLAFDDEEATLGRVTVIV